MTGQFFRLLTLFGFALLIGSAWADQLTGRVVGIADGDTLTVLTAQRQQHRVRLTGIDAPEKRQAFGQVSRRHLSDLAYDKTVSVVFHKRDRYKRILGKVLVNGVDVASIRSNPGWSGITSATSASNWPRIGWPTEGPRRKPGRSGAASGETETLYRPGHFAGVDRCAAGSPDSHLSRSLPIYSARARVSASTRGTTSHRRKPYCWRGTPRGATGSSCPYCRPQIFPANALRWLTEDYWRCTRRSVYPERLEILARIIPFWPRPCCAHVHACR